MNARRTLRLPTVIFAPLTSRAREKSTRTSAECPLTRFARPDSTLIDACGVAADAVALLRDSATSTATMNPSACRCPLIRPGNCTAARHPCLDLGDYAGTPHRATRESHAHPAPAAPLGTRRDTNRRERPRHPLGLARDRRRDVANAPTAGREPRGPRRRAAQSRRGQL